MLLIDGLSNQNPVHYCAPSKVMRAIVLDFVSYKELAGARPGLACGLAWYRFRFSTYLVVAFSEEFLTTQQGLYTLS